ncbi:hypothetical protein L1889_18390 [Paenalcaligenes niemegkensis]|uniref:hypothetical protein n=1 Tax=Paenalcaligenes niemegkensis TaxID=2895469 RepID=UPI001EE918C4|nr:hypothetical protein [Paenalcaligenes niemegkensis]MCQ9618410.1 hypothetical protein [Paenalcaligenes niemegkensis]
MAVGFQVMFPGGGQAQIDDTYRNYHLRKSGTFYNGDFVNDPNQAYSPSRRARINLAGMNSPVVVLRPLGSNGQTMCGIEYGQGWADVLCWYNAVQTAGVEYYVYDDYSPPPVNYGLEIYNAQGRRVYHSNWRRMRVLGMRVIPASGTPSLTRLTDYSISDIAALSSKSGFLMPYTRIGTQAVAEGGSHIGLLAACTF